MAWSIVDFGKHNGKTLPQIVFTDPDWFFWAVETGVFQSRGSLESEAMKINAYAQVIRIPGNDAANMEAEYFVHRPTGKFARMDIVPASRPNHQGSSPAFRKKVIDLKVARSIASYDKLGCKTLVSCAKQTLFGKSVRMTKKLCEEFFDSPSNFV